ncbi:nucleoside phosphorylase [Veillonella agrestimuris]|uniref:nucleoside phosphorylase n=1 Tax=Veillonella agrestimuris TaxID=2941340 RepID=UPI00203D6A92|nr:nucleoside phosphorylase [Veillonella agrestimuris]
METRDNYHEAQEAPQPHIQLTSSIGTTKAIIVGDPKRVDAIAAHLDNATPVTYNREYKSVVGTYKGQRILAMSTGIGAPSAGIGIEELHNIGIQYIIRVGSCGAMKSTIGLGETIIAEGVVRDDGLSRRYVPEIYPAVPSSALLNLAHRHAPNAHYGIVRSHDGFYCDNNQDVESFWANKGILADDMESGILMVIGRLRGLHTLSILNNVVLYQGDVMEGINNLAHSDDALRRGEEQSILTALNILCDESLENN